MINIFICDDDELFKASLAQQVKKYCDDAKLDYAITQIGSFDEIKTNLSKADILFLDVMLNGENTINKISSEKIELPFETVILTSFPREIYNISKIDPTYYLDKTKLDESQINSALKKCVEKIVLNGKSKIIIEQGKTSTTVDLKKVTHIEAQNRNSIIYFSNSSSIKTSMKFSYVISKCGANFQQCSRSFAVNFDYVLGFEWHKYIMFDKSQINISRSNYKKLTQEYKNYLEI